MDTTTAKAPKTIKVSVMVTLEIDPAALRAEYGYDDTFTNADLRNDVIQSAYNAVVQTAYPEDALNKIIVSSELRSPVAK